MNLESKIEAILFWKGESLSLKRLAEIFKCEKAEIRSALEILETNLKSRGLILVWKEEEVMLGSTPEVSSLIEALTKEELTKDIGKAGLETLSVILYKGPISRREIDFIRGVNSTFILRNLLIRGLVEKITNPKDERSFLYKPTFELLSYLGVGKLEEIPDYTQVIERLNQFKQESEKTIQNNPEREDQDNETDA